MSICFSKQDTSHRLRRCSLAACNTGHEVFCYSQVWLTLKVHVVFVALLAMAPLPHFPQLGTTSLAAAVPTNLQWHTEYFSILIRSSRLRVQ